MPSGTLKETDESERMLDFWKSLMKYIRRFWFDALAKMSLAEPSNVSKLFLFWRISKPRSSLTAVCCSPKLKLRRGASVHMTRNSSVFECDSIISRANACAWIQ